MDFEHHRGDDDEGPGSKFREALNAGRFDDARALVEQRAADPSVNAFRARAALREEERVAELRGSLRRSGIPVRGGPVDVAWVSDEGERVARERLPGWGTGLVVDEPFAERAARMELSLRQRRVDGDGPFVVVTIDIERKFLSSLEHKREAAAVLARTLDRLGDRAATYADVCRSPETDELLHAWEAEDPAAWKRFRDLLDRSGIEPPDTDLLAWGQVMGLEEARVREQVATALEKAIEDGRLAPGSPGFRRRQAEVANAALHEPWDGGDGRSRLDAVRSERLERWLERGHTRGSAERDAIIAPVADLGSGRPYPGRFGGRGCSRGAGVMVAQAGAGRHRAYTDGRAEPRACPRGRHSLAVVVGQRAARYPPAIRVYTDVMKIVKVRRVGNSNVVSIPRELESRGYVPGSSVLVEELDSGELRITPTEQLRQRIRAVGRRVVDEHTEALRILADHDPDAEPRRS